MWSPKDNCRQEALKKAAETLCMRTLNWKDVGRMHANYSTTCVFSIKVSWSGECKAHISWGIYYPNMACHFIF